jgi:hypothetical protein
VISTGARGGEVRRIDRSPRCREQLFRVPADDGLTRRNMDNATWVRRQLSAAVVVLTTLQLGYGCGDDGAVKLDGGTVAPSGAGSGDGDGAPLACAAPTAEALLDDVAVRSLQVAGDQLVFVDDKGGVADGRAMTGAILRLDRNGGEPTTLYEAPISMSVMNLVVGGDTVYFLLSEWVDYEHLAFLYAVPLAGGGAVRVSGTESPGFDWLFGRVFAVDDEFAYVVDARSNQTLLRVSLTDGSETVIAAHDGLAITQAQKLGDTIWYTPSQGIDGIWRVPVDAEDASAAVRVGTGLCTVRMIATDKGIYCGQLLRLDKYDLDGESYATVLDLRDEDPGAIGPSEPYGSTLYVYPLASPTEGRPLRRLDTRTDETEIVGCDLRSVRNLTVGEDDVYWVETRDDGDGELTSIMRLPR